MALVCVACSDREAAEAFLRRMEMERALIWQIGFILVVGREALVAEKASSTCPMHSEHLFYALNMDGIEPPPFLSGTEENRAKYNANVAETDELK